MKKSLGLVALWASLLSAGHLYGAAACSEESAASQGDVLTVRGEIVDMTCFMGHEGHGKDHRECTQACLMGGAPAGLLTEHGSVYLLLEDYTDKEPYAALRTMGGFMVKVKGKVFKRGDVLSLIVSKVEKV